MRSESLRCNGVAALRHPGTQPGSRALEQTLPKTTALPSGVTS